MIKLVIGELDQWKIYVFGLTETDLNRLEFNGESIFFDFGYANHPELFGLILYFNEFKNPEDMAANRQVILESCIPFLDLEHGIVPETLRVFAFAQSTIQEFRNAPFWGYEAKIEITNAEDQQLFFAGRDEKDIMDYLQKSGLI